MKVMDRLAGLMVVGVLLVTGAWGQAGDAAQWSKQARAVTITRDDWGIAHVHGKTDGDAVFGMIYAQCEDDFNRVETNYLTSLGRTAEAEGAGSIWADLRQKLFIDPVELKRLYGVSPVWLQKLMSSWANGLNFYLANHPEVKPKVIRHFEPWMALSFTEGSIGGDIERVDLRKLQEFYGTEKVTELTPKLSELEPVTRWVEPEPKGSNGIAIAPGNTVGHHALLLINPHTSFFFRSELQMTSDEGLDAYGATTWGQFFIYQGFNERAGWMHTSSGVDAVDEYFETVKNVGGKVTYRYGEAEKPMRMRMITVPYKTAAGMKKRDFLAYFTDHGPIIRADGEKWVSIKLMNIPVPALEQSYLRTKARSYKEFSKTMELMANSSNNTVFADAEGDIAYWHGNFIPRRDTKFAFTKPVDGSNPATDWHGLLKLEEIPQLLNPKSGYLFNVNDSPWNGAGESSLKKADFPAYVENGIESARGIHAIRVLKDKRDFTADSLLAAAYDSYLPWFARTIPELVKAWDALPPDAPEKSEFKDQIAVLRGWDLRWGADSVATSLAVFWGTELMRTIGPMAQQAGKPSEEYVVTFVPADALLAALKAASGNLIAGFGRWQTPWGEINRFQRLTGDIFQPFSDAAPSLPVPFTSALWGSLASFGAHAFPGTKKWYGTLGNSFVAVVEFGDKVRARAVTAGGESGHPESAHFIDQEERYANGSLREVYFYADQLKGHTERVYRPGE